MGEVVGFLIAFVICEAHGAFLAKEPDLQV
jgi:hypothetical protein